MKEVEEKVKMRREKEATLVSTRQKLSTKHHGNFHKVFWWIFWRGNKFKPLVLLSSCDFIMAVSGGWRAHLHVQEVLMVLEDTVMVLKVGHLIWEVIFWRFQ